MVLRFWYILDYVGHGFVQVSRLLYTQEWNRQMVIEKRLLWVDDI